MYDMTTILNNLFSVLLFQIEYILGNLIILASLVLEEFILALTTPAGLIASISLILFLEYLIIKNIGKNKRKTNLKQNIVNIPLCNIPPLSTATLYKA